MYENARDYSPIVKALQPMLTNLPGKIVAIGGPLGAGKTTLGRYLAYRFNVTLIETDLFRIKNSKGRLLYCNDVLADIIASRIDSFYPRPVIIESAVVLRLLSEIGLRADFYVHVTSGDDVVDDEVVDEVAQYEAEYKPAESAQYKAYFPASP